MRFGFFYIKHSHIIRIFCVVSVSYNCFSQQVSEIHINENGILNLERINKIILNYPNFNAKSAVNGITEITQTDSIWFNLIVCDLYTLNDNIEHWIPRRIHITQQFGRSFRKSSFHTLPLSLITQSTQQNSNQFCIRCVPSHVHRYYLFNVLTFHLIDRHFLFNY
jgi:hypothetical protein